MSQEGVWGKEEGRSGPSLLGACLQASLGLGIFANIGLVVLCKARHVTHQNGEGLHGLRGSVSHLRGGLAAGAQEKGGRDSGQGSIKGEDLQSLGGVLPELLLTQPSALKSLQLGREC